MPCATSMTITWYPVLVSHEASAGPAIPAPLITTVGCATAPE
jgi:hypothetical protein